METTGHSIDSYSRLSKEAPADITLLKLEQQGLSLLYAFKRKNKNWLFTSNSLIKYVFNEATPTLEAMTRNRHVLKALI